MKHVLCLLLGLLLLFIYSNAQAITEQVLENLQVDQDVGDDDSWMQVLSHFREHAIDLNKADAEELKQLMLLNDLQIENLISYRRLLGALTSIYELQAVPGLDIPVIKKLLPYIRIGSDNSSTDEIKARLAKGTHSFLLRVSQHLEPASGFLEKNGERSYQGSAQHLLFRYKYAYKNLLQYGIVGDKDAGESFFKGAQKKGFDFYSFHLHLKKIGAIETLVLGDFTVNMGQGLVQWQSLAFKKSSGVMSIKRQSPVLRPYNSPGEFAFHRGAGITICKNKLSITAFASMRKLSANIGSDSSSFYSSFITSFITSGYHRSEKEQRVRNNVSQVSGGSNLMWRDKKFNVGLNTIAYRFSLPLVKKQEPYNLFAICDQSWFNWSVNYSYTLKNIHFFGEAAMDRKFSSACINGMLVSIDPQIDFSVIYRAITMNYQAVYGNAFTENTLPSNEYGLYTGISFRITSSLKLDAYADLYKFPWLKLSVDAPAQGSEFLFQLQYNPNRNTEMYIRYRAEKKPANNPGNAGNSIEQSRRQNLRSHFYYKINRSLSIRTRAELSWFMLASPKQEG